MTKKGWENRGGRRRNLPAKAGNKGDVDETTKRKMRKSTHEPRRPFCVLGSRICDARKFNAKKENARRVPKGLSAGLEGEANLRPSLLMVARPYEKNGMGRRPRSPEGSRSGTWERTENDPAGARRITVREEGHRFGLQSNDCPSKSRRPQSQKKEPGTG